MRELIARRRFTEAEVCERMRMKRITFKRKLDGSRRFLVEELVELAVILDAEPSDFLRGIRPSVREDVSA
ncbi:hypothetical protein [Nocardia farcinica]|uniref:hypothetical protein n=1 Tax=Nocardia farcinica TaxID=37329 RepID=UPI0024575893|nr:hypothetical protein [Nocardia farcinica]